MTHLQQYPIDPAYLLSCAHNPMSGAIVLFSGETRDHHNEKKVLYLEFEAYEPLAEKMIERILQDAGENWKLQNAICVHRLGKVEISEPAVCVITGSSHRKEAYSANRYIIDRVKHEVPIWKREFYSDGSVEWGLQCPGCAHEEHFGGEEISDELQRYR
ncbi:MAG: molybdenum cofactor biosynthesis protein MoaE [Leptospira sp.]|nr:molybdenum cofactor biosynthesis protein MoaE [Leptospira sp.]